ncbi:type VI secretion system membrane subunit TssM [Rhizobium paknamense]|uniref:type VI secretion system membrane subunit TssM n=1 Tax=Rhizobium paknamense TaxID=1206817 RepID=UPI0027D830B5|nr:type VI secretion system membrane subunit TssM [Rhizobium paknamense]
MNPLSWFYSIRSYVDSYAGIVGRRFISLIWVIALAVVIWFYGYLLAFGTFKPFASVPARIWAIIALFAVWAIYMAVTLIRARKQDQELVDSIEQQALATRQAEVGEIENRLKEALALLKRITRKRFGYIYDLPWYVIFGAPGSGKTTALTNSGLQFPLGDALGTEAVKGIGGTRNCNWWFADEAILIDTAGRYTTQDDLDGSSKAGWDGFLNLIRRYRRAQPVNGALVTLSIGDLMTRDPEAQREELRAIRKRLAELDEQLGARVPVYLLLTKADLLTGFVEFFEGFNKSDREQVWGMTFSLEDSDKAADLPQRFAEEFALLQQRVDAMLIERLQQEQNAEIRGRIFRFPAELAALQERLNEAVTELASGSALIEAPFIRGFYFVSATQPDEALSASPAKRSRRSYFLPRLFKQVIFNEAALVARDKRLSRRQLILRRVSYGVAVAVLALVFSGWTLTFIQNRQALAEADERLNAYDKLIQGVGVRDVNDADFLRILPALDNLRAVPQGFGEGRLWIASFGLNQSSKIESRQRDAYQRALNGLLLPRMLVQLQKDLTDEKDVTRAFNGLKLYAMLGGLGRLDPDFVSYQAEQMFNRLYPGEGRAVARRALIAHARAMAGGALPPIEIDRSLMAKARDIIRDQTVAERAYDILAGSRAARSAAPWTPSAAFGPLADKAFERKSGAPLTEGVEGLFTATGYRQVVLPKIADAAREALQEEWVRGSPAALRGQTLESVSQAALQIYFDRFEQRWASVLSDITVKPSQSLGDAAETSRILANERNIIGQAARSIAEATDLRPKGDVSGVATLVSSASGDTVAAMLATSMEAPDPYGKLRDALQPPAESEKSATDGKKPVSQVDAILPRIDTLHDQLARSATSSAEVAKVFDVDGQLTKANQDLLQDARRLPAPLDTWVAGLAADIGSLAVKSARSRIADLWSAEGASLCSSIVTGRYPFDRSSNRDVAMNDFIRLFGPKGLFRSFFDQRLAPFVDQAASPWGWKGTFGAAGIPSDAIASFEKADQITRAFFPNGSETPAITLNVKPVSLSDQANAVMLEIEGERVVYFHGPIQAKSITWPSRQAANMSRIAFQPGGWQQAKTENGDWSPFRLFDDAEISNEASDTFRLRFATGGQTAEFEVQFGSVLNPFRLKALADFSCPAQF